MSKIPEDNYSVLRGLRAQAEAALQAGDTMRASRFAQKLLDENTYRASWNYGNEIHAANQILGLAALRNGDTAAAKAYLLAACKTPGSPQLDSFGPIMLLAQALLELGERAVVIEYLGEVARFWATAQPTSNIVLWLFGRWMASRNTRRLDIWKSAIRAGQTPRLNRVPLDQPRAVA